MEKSVLTIATGNPIYVRMATNLARSFKWWHQNSNIQFILATDLKDIVPSDVKKYIEIIELKKDELGLGFSSKLHLDHLIKADKTIFIDADCLCFGSLESVFERFSGHAVSVIGKRLTKGNFFGDVPMICQHFNVPDIPYFLGGIYYLEKGQQIHQVYEKARELESQYDELGLIRLRGRPNEEPLIAISMALYGQTEIPEDGTIKGEPMFYPSGLLADVLNGKTSLWNLPNHPKYSTVWGLKEAHPIIIHFHNEHTDRAVYKSEALKLELVMRYGWPCTVANIFTFIRFLIPEFCIDTLKNIFRPFYRKLFGLRPVPTSKRIVRSDLKS